MTKVKEKEKVKKEVVTPPKIKSPVTYQDHLDVGFVNITQSESEQSKGKRVKEIKNVEGQTLYRLEKI